MWRERRRPIQASIMIDFQSIRELHCLKTFISPVQNLSRSHRLTPKYVHEVTRLSDQQALFFIQSSGQPPLAHNNIAHVCMSIQQERDAPVPSPQRSSQQPWIPMLSALVHDHVVLVLCPLGQPHGLAWHALAGVAFLGANRRHVLALNACSMNR